MRIALYIVEDSEWHYHLQRIGFSSKWPNPWCAKSIANIFSLRLPIKGAVFPHLRIFIPKINWVCIKEEFRLYDNIYNIAYYKKVSLRGVMVLLLFVMKDYAKVLKARSCNNHFCLMSTLLPPLLYFLSTKGLLLVLCLGRSGRE